MFLEDREGKKRVSETKRKLLLDRQKGKCAHCKKSFKIMRVIPHLHHIGKSDRIDALELLCPNCHSKAHKRRTKTDSWTGVKYTILEKKRMGKTKVTKRKKRKKKSDALSLF